jgi:anti-anti-sigma factor
MSFSVITEILENVVKLTLEGALDSSTAPKLNEEVQKIILHKPDELVMDLEKLNFMSSAGLRIIIYARQKLGSTAGLILVKPQDQVVETLKITGLLSSVSIVDKYPV